MSDLKDLIGTEDFITELFERVDAAMAGVPRHPQASLWPGEVVTLALLFAIKGVRDRAFYRWVVRDWLKLFPKVPDRTRLFHLFRLFATHRGWTDRFMAPPTFFGVAVYPELERLVVKTLGVADVLREALAPLADRIRAAFL